MNIDAAREFLALARCLNFTEAAASLNITQPALSKHIIALEKEFNCRLLDRNRRGVNLTESGKILFQSATVIVEEYDKAREAIDALRNRVTVRLVGDLDDEDDSTLASLAAVVARQNNLANVVLEPSDEDPLKKVLSGEADIMIGDDEDDSTLASLAAVVARQNNLANVVLEPSDEDPLKKVLSGEADIMIGYARPEYIGKEDLVCDPFVTRSLVAVVNADHPFALREGISWADLRDQTLLKFVSGKTNPAWAQFQDFCERRGFTPRTRTIPASNNFEFFSTPLKNDVLIWKSTERNLWAQFQDFCERRGFTPRTRTIPASNNFEFFSTPLKNDVLIWKSTERNLGLLLDTGRRCGVPITDDDTRLTSYAIYKAENREKLEGFRQAVQEARTFLNNRKSHRQIEE